MADRFAAASMMAGHPNETRPDGLRNLPFALFMGGKDAAYDRNKIAASWKETLAGLREADPGGYDHEVTIYPECGHWMERKDRVALPWMAARTRVAWPKRVVWLQDDVAHDRLYWLGSDADHRGARAWVEATVEAQHITITSEDVTRLSLHLHDRLIGPGQGDQLQTWNGEPAVMVRSRGPAPRSRRRSPAGPTRPWAPPPSRGQPPLTSLPEPPPRPRSDHVDPDPSSSRWPPT